VQTAARSLVEENGADVRQAVAVKCTDGVTRTVNVDKSLNYPANTADGSVYGTTLGYTVTNGQVDVSSLLLSSLEGPFVASEGE
ncbi:hypothetical protein ACSTB0_13535, partial [Faecalibacterium wellingii]|uniref:hypothetical protein n=1 Tax=Faecalibacterium wellingii TaxID=2929491 RepID=UPI003ED928A8